MVEDKDSVIATLQQKLASCSGLFEAGDYSNSEQSVADLVEFLNAVSDSLVVAESENDELEYFAVEITTHIQQYLALSSIKQEVVDALPFELPKAVARFACVSRKCLEVAENVVDQFVERCSPRDMLSILCAALGSPSELFTAPSYFIPLFGGVMKVLVLIQRRQYEQVKAAVPVILNVLKTMAFKSDDEDTDLDMLFHKATGIANSIWAVCVKLEGKDHHKLRALFGLYILQIMTLVSNGISQVSRCLPVVLELSVFLQHCQLSYIDLVTGCEVDVIYNSVLGDGWDDGMDFFSQVKLGAALGVIWSYMSSEVAVAAKADMLAVIAELQGNWSRRWEAIGMLKHVFVCAKLSWEVKKHAVKFLLDIMDGIVSLSYDDQLNHSMPMTTFYTSLQAIEMVIMYASDAVVRKNAFTGFKKVLADIPLSVRLGVFRALITNSDSSSMVGLLLDLVKEEMRIEKAKMNSSSNSVNNNEVHQIAVFWSPSVLELVEMVVRPPEGGPPVLPDNCDAVLSALNLYRFILITEATGNSNHTGILSKDKLQKTYKEWLLPLRTLVTGTGIQIQRDDDELACNTVCALNPVELVLYRCIELVEEKLKQI